MNIPGDNFFSNSVIFYLGYFIPELKKSNLQRNLHEVLRKKKNQTQVYKEPNKVYVNFYLSSNPFHSLHSWVFCYIPIIPFNVTLSYTCDCNLVKMAFSKHHIFFLLFPPSQLHLISFQVQPCLPPGFLVLFITLVLSQLKSLFSFL